MRLTSPVFNHEGDIPAVYTCDGKDINPPLEISEIPEGTETLALIMDDPDAPGRTFIHWVAYDIEPAEAIEENTSPGTGGLTDFGRKDYGGPCPPSGTHRYFFKVYALDTRLDAAEGLSKEELVEAMDGHILDNAELIGLYSRK